MIGRQRPVYNSSWADKDPFITHVRQTKDPIIALDGQTKDPIIIYDGQTKTQP